MVGTLDLEAALRGEARLKPGLLAQADGGLLYIDEVNLLPDHLVDVLLDAAAMGVVRVQRDALSAEAPARFALIGSMNPEEGNLRPQFLDRFGLCVDVLAPLNPAERAEIIRRRMRFEADADAFAAQWQPHEDALREQLAQASARLGGVEVPDHLLGRITAMTTAAGVRSLRADLVLYRAARALAALEVRDQVQEKDLEVVAPLVLNHRLEAPHSPQPPEPPSPPPGETSQQPEPQPSAPEEIFAPTKAPRLDLKPQARGGRVPGSEREGRLLRSVQDDQPTRLHLPSTLQAAALRGSQHIDREDFRAPVHENAGGRRVLFVADASGSVGVAGRMGAVKAAMLDVLSAQGQRDRVALMTFRGTGAQLLLDWSNDVSAAQEAIRQAPTGGRTPLAHALRQAGQMLAGQRQAELVIFTDGRVNVPLSAGSDAWADALAQAALLRVSSALVVDTESGNIRLGRAAQLAKVLGGRMQALERVSESD